MTLIIKSKSEYFSFRCLNDEDLEENIGKFYTLKFHKSPLETTFIALAKEIRQKGYSILLQTSSGQHFDLDLD